jgi:predicted small metal-binding protein
MRKPREGLAATLALRICTGFEKPSRPDSRSVPPMKTMTCKQLGGPCDVEHHGKDHNEVIKAQDRHLKAQVAAGDEAHREAMRRCAADGSARSAVSGGTGTSSVSSPRSPRTPRGRDSSGRSNPTMLGEP